MKILKNNPFTNRTLFNQDPIAIYTQKKKTDVNPNSDSKSNTSILKQFERENKSESKRFLKLIDTKSFYRKGSKPAFSQRDQDDTQTQTRSQTVLRESTENLQDQNESDSTLLNSSQIESFNLSVLFKKLINYWGLRMPVRTTRINLLAISTLYFVAVLSTIQRQEATRWLSNLCYTKLPGYSMRFQDMSWETFQNLRDKQVNPYSNPTSLKANQATLTAIGSWISFIDLYKDKACIYLRSPWEKEIRKDYVGFFMEKSQHITLDKTEDDRTESHLNPKYISLPWYRIEAFQQPSRVVLATSEKKSSTNNLLPKHLVAAELDAHHSAQTFNGTNSKLATAEQPRWVDSSAPLSNSRLISNDLCSRRERSLIHLSQLNSQAESNKSAPLNSSLIPHTMSGLQFVVPFQGSRGRVYVQNDSIPVKLESAHSRFDFMPVCSTLDNSPARSDERERNQEIPHMLTNTPYLSNAALEQREQHKLQALIKSNQLFFGKELYSLQEGLRDLFYSYGFFPPSDLAQLIDDRSSQLTKRVESLVNDKGKQKERQQFEKDFKDREALHPRERKHATAQEDFQEKVGKQVESEEIVNHQSAHNESVYKELLLFVSQQLDKARVDTVTGKRAVAGLYPEVKEKHKSTDSFDSALPLTKGDTKNRESFSQLNPATADSSPVLNIENIIDELYKQPEAFASKTSSTLVHSPSSSSSKHCVVKRARAANPVLKNWALLANANSFKKPDQAVLNTFERNRFIPSRLMSGYKFPDYTKHKINSLFSQYVFEKLLLSCFVDFSHSDLINQVVLRPLYIKLPPTLPFSFYKNFVLSLSENSFHLAPPHLSSERLRSENKAQNSLSLRTDLTKLSNLPLDLEYRSSTLKELQEVENVFSKLGRDFQEYLSLPKDSPLVIKMSPSLEEDKLIRLEAEELRKTETAIEKLHRLQKLQKRENKFEDAKQLRPFAYENKLVFCCDNDDHNSLNQSTVVEAKRWLDLRLGSGNMLSDRKQSFFGRKHVLTKRLVAQEEKEINDQIMKSSFCTPFTSSTHSQNKEQKGFDTALRRNHSKWLPPEKQANSKVLSESSKRAQPRLVPYKDLQKAGLKRKIQLLGFPGLSARNKTGAENRTQKVKEALHGQVIKTPYSHLRWQRKRFRSSLLGTPSDRHLTLPELDQNEWQRMLEWQVKNYLFLEEKRLDPLEKEYVGEQLKVKQLQVFLPWVTIKTNSSRPFQWPLTRLDYAFCTEPSANTSDKERSSLAQDVADRTPYQIPVYRPVYYFDSGHSVSLSIAPKHPTALSKQAVRSRGKKRWLGLFNSWGAPPFLRDRVVQPSTPDRLVEAMCLDLESNTYLCEPITSHSWLLVYRLLIAFALKDVVKCVFRVTLRRFTTQVPGDVTFSPAALVSAHVSNLKAESAQSIYIPQKRFQDVTIHEKSMLTLNEIIWHLRNSCRSRTSPRALLLVGPAKRDKTALVQSIASEGGGLPLIVQPINDLLSDEINAYRRLERLFAVASNQAPCVVFLDNIDSVGKSREKVMTSEKGQDDCLFALKEFTQDARMYSASVSASMQANLLTKAGHRETQQYSDWQFNPLAANPLDQPGVEFTVGGQGWAHTIKRIERHEDLEEWSKILRFKRRRLNLLLRLLTIIDGALPLKRGILVVATSEQPARLDPALLRAGRFDRRIHLSSPSQERRIQLFKRETETLGSMQSMPWEYLGSRTTNMSLADISSAIHYSTIRALLDNTVHTVETLEHGLNCVTGFKHKAVFVSDKPKNDPFHYSRLAFYQAGRAVVHNLLLGHPELGFCSLNEGAVDQDEIVSSSDVTREHLKVHTSEHVSLQAISPEMRFRSNRYQAGRTSTDISSFQKLSDRGGAQLVSKSPPLLKGQATQVRMKRQLLCQNNLKAQSITNQQAEMSQSVENLKTQAQHNRFLGYQPNSSVHLQKSQQVTSARTRSQLEIRLIGLYAGKAAELLYLSSNVVPDYKSDLRNARTAGWLWQSNIGFSELFTASSLIHLMVDRWYLYSQKLVTSKTNRLICSLNGKEVEMEDEYLFPYVQRFCYQLQVAHIPSTFWDLPDHPTLKGSPLQKNKENKKESDYPDLNQIYQNRINASWWNAKVCHTIEDNKRPFGRWYRMYIPKTEERDDNEEWLPPDVVYHQPLRLSNLTTRACYDNASRAYPNMRERNAKSNNSNQTKTKRSLSLVKLFLKNDSQNTQRVPNFKTLNDLYLFERDNAYHNAVMSSFYQAFSLVNKNRELLDMFADHLVRFQTLRSYEMSNICSSFSFSSHNESS